MKIISAESQEKKKQCYQNHVIIYMLKNDKFNIMHNKGMVGEDDGAG